jgi:hypothetical protein
MSTYLPVSAKLVPSRRRDGLQFLAGVMIGFFWTFRRAIGFEMRLVALLRPKNGFSVNCVLRHQDMGGDGTDLGDLISYCRFLYQTASLSAQQHHHCLSQLRRCNVAILLLPTPVAENITIRAHCVTCIELQPGRPCCEAGRDGSLSLHIGLYQAQLNPLHGFEG